jgi:hypothetical protein
MNLMLTLIFCCIAVGLVAPRLGRREHLIIAGFATVATVLWFSSRRFM